MSKLQSVWIKPEWYRELRPFLERASKEKDKNLSSTSRTTLKMLDLGAKRFNQDLGDQVPLLPKQLKLLASLAAVLGLKEAEERLGR